jgi:predicted Fe-S protein YdhL (DUF1289 family)
MAPIVSPCIRLCAIDHATRLCAGCGRTLEEIGNWLRYDEATRREIMASLPGRMARSNGTRREDVRP